MMLVLHGYGCVLLHTLISHCFYCRLFRRGSRTPLTSVTEEGCKSPLFQPGNTRHSSLPVCTIPVPPSCKPEFTQSLDESNLCGIYNVISSVSGRYEDQRSPPPPMPVRDGNSDTNDETRDTTEALHNLDEFLDLMNDSASDRIDKQRSSLTGNSPSHDGVGSDDVSDGGLGIPKYYLSTSSPWLQANQGHHGQNSPAGQQGGFMRGVTPPANSMPNLSTRDEEDDDEQARRTPPPSYFSQEAAPSISSSYYLHHISGDHRSNQSDYSQRSHEPEMENAVQSHDQMQLSEYGDSSEPSAHRRHQQQQQQQHDDLSSNTGERERPRQRQSVNQSGASYNWWDSNDGDVQMHDGSFLSPTKRRVSDEMRSPSPLAVTSYSSNTNTRLVIQCHLN